MKSKNRKLRKIIYLIPVLCIIAVGSMFYMLWDMNHKIEESYYDVQDEEQDNENVTNIVENEIAEKPVNNTVQNTEKNQNVQNIQEENTNKPTGNTENSTDKKEEAIKIVKEKWGDDNTVLFDCYVNSKGEYIVSITTTDGKNIAYYQVDLETKSAEVY